MSGDKEKKKKLIGKTFFSEYGVCDTEKLLEGWEAVPLDNDVYEVLRSNGSSFQIKNGTEIPPFGPIQLNDEGNLEVGKFTILVGKDLVHGMTAKKTRRKGEYFFNQEGKRAKKAQVGDTVAGIGVVGEPDEFGNLKVGDKTVPIAKKRKELKLLVYSDKHESFSSGYKCHFNMVMPGSKKNHTDGIPGVFFPPKGKGPGKFCEIDEDGKTLQTAIFWPSRNKNFLVGKIRTSEEARLEKALVERVKELEKEAKDFGLEPEEHFDYVIAKEELAKCNNDDWQSHQFSVNSGHSLIFGLEEPQKSYSYGR